MPPRWQAVSCLLRILRHLWKGVRRQPRILPRRKQGPRHLTRILCSRRHGAGLPLRILLPSQGEHRRRIPFRSQGARPARGLLRRRHITPYLPGADPLRQNS
jgi:hypothetical protein